MDGCLGSKQWHRYWQPKEFVSTGKFRKWLWRPGLDLPDMEMLPHLQMLMVGLLNIFNSFPASHEYWRVLSVKKIFPDWPCLDWWKMYELRSWWGPFGWTVDREDRLDTFRNKESPSTQSQLVKLALSSPELGLTPNSVVTICSEFSMFVIQLISIPRFGWVAPDRMKRSRMS